jgi:uncharacterized hydrophobic protein (TIGR00271 family)
MLKNWIIYQVSEERRVALFKEISEGSTPAPRFYLMVVASNLIAVLGLLSNSPAVVIGAMLVAPLMTPIFGISLALIRGAPRLLARSLRAEAQGVGLCVLLSFLFGLIPLSMEPTPEMLARFQPNLLDLMVAVFAGLAGSYAMVDERISPTLPGVVIATAIVPPLANTGLSLAMGQFAGGLASFFLFLANFFSILIAASVVFAVTGMGAHTRGLSKRDLVRRFGLASISLSIIATVFTFSLVKLVQKRRLKQSIRSELVQALADFPGTYLRELMWHKDQDYLHVLATVRTPSVIHPERVDHIQDRMTKMLEREVRLIVRNNLVKDIAAVGSTAQVRAVEDEDEGEFLADQDTPIDEKVSLAEQVLWEHFSKWPGFQVQSVDYRATDTYNFVLATVYSPYPFGAAELTSLEEAIRERLNDPEILLGISRSKPIVMDSIGSIIPEWSLGEGLSEEKKALRELIKKALQEEIYIFADVFLRRCHFRIIQDQWKVLIETTGLRALEPRELQQIKTRVLQKAGQPLELYAWFRYEAVVTPSGYESYRDFMKGPMEYNKQEWEKTK